MCLCFNFVPGTIKPYRNSCIDQRVRHISGDLRFFFLLKSALLLCHRMYVPGNILPLVLHSQDYVALAGGERLGMSRSLFTDSNSLLAYWLFLSQHAGGVALTKYRQSEGTTCNAILLRCTPVVAALDALKRTFEVCCLLTETALGLHIICTCRYHHLVFFVRFRRVKNTTCTVILDPFDVSLQTPPTREHCTPKPEL